MSPRLPPVLAWAVDLLLLVAFILVGRASHDEDPAGFVSTLLPFLAGLQTGWLLRAGQPPLALLRSGVVVWVTTLVVGVLLRVATGEGAAPAFVLVAAAVLAAFFLGWRALATLAVRMSRRRPTPAEQGAQRRL